ncbi:TetR/AcrR family transcriptional regulator [Streptomyces sp. NPDC102264]|uniref:TetR/AcrR family transcriptional regulator n=1 Tax=Streptomyces sp. NPDC102264 TaxID=3366149 RepID=UPI0038037C94
MTPGQNTIVGLRARKKRRTREALVRVALELFTTQGYEQTTVDEITDAVDVSQRTFFRYFTSKEEAAFAVVDLVENKFLDSLRARPAEETPFEAMRNAVESAWGSVSEALEAIVPVELYLRTCLLIESTPALVAVHLRRTAELEEVLSRLIADREGLDVNTDPRPRVVVAAFTGVMRVAGRLWGQGRDASVEALQEITRAYLDHLTPALAGNWRTPECDTERGPA